MLPDFGERVIFKQIWHTLIVLYSFPTKATAKLMLMLHYGFPLVDINITLMQQFMSHCWSGGRGRGGQV